MATLTVEVDDCTFGRLASIAAERQVELSSLATEALELLVLLEDQPDHSYDWSAEDLAAIREGLEQLERGEGISQEELKREIEQVIRS